jgi:hypothetical protein
LWLGIAAADDAPLRIGRNEGPLSLLTDSSVAVMQSAYDRVGVKVRFERYPLRRSLSMANAGDLDGDTMRIADVGELYPNLIRIDVPINHVEITAYARAPCPPALSGWDALHGRRVAYERGVLVIERRRQGIESVQAQSEPELFRLLASGAAEIALGTGQDTDIVLRRSGEKGLCRIDGALERVPLYHYLHQRHAALAQRLKAELQAMQKRGEIDAILKRERAKHAND